jgi:hypothetical protein
MQVPKSTVAKTNTLLFGCVWPAVELADQGENSGRQIAQYRSSGLAL